MSDGKLLRLDVGKHAEDGVFSGRWIDVRSVAGEPGQKLRFRVH